MLDHQLQLPQLIAHRGARNYAPENTLAALKKASELGAQWVEFDVTLTRDHQAIIIHDARLNRTTDGRGFVSRTSASAISKLDAGSWFAPEFSGEKVPTLDEWLDCAAALELGVNIEIKGNARQAKLLADHVVASLSRFWSPDLPRPLISSLNIPCLEAVRALQPKLLLGYISDTWPRRWQEVLNRLNCVSIHVNHKRLTANRVADVKASGRYVLAYTVNDPERANELFAMGVDSIFSDDPLLFKTTS